eukprot:gene1669-1954_t
MYHMPLSSDMSTAYRENTDSKLSSTEANQILVNEPITESSVTLQDVQDEEGPSKSRLDLAWQNVLTRLESGQDNYTFADNNPLLQESGVYERGVLLYREGRILEAVQAFEAALQQDSEHSAAWFMLGTCHAENDEDRRAITCQLRARETDAYNLDALLSLGTSYVNEMNSLGALDALRAWVKHNPKFGGLEVAADGYSDGTLMDEVMQLMLEAERWDPHDADTHVVLGVLYNVSQDYDSALSHLRTALSHRPEDFALLNKVAATLANSERSAEAVPLYAQALQLRPGYVRGWLNLGVAYANMGTLEEAVRSYLQALRLNPAASHIWDNARSVLSAMNRPDLLELVERRDPDLIDAR